MDKDINILVVDDEKEIAESLFEKWRI